MSNKHKQEPNVDVRNFKDQLMYPTEVLELALRNYPKNLVIRQELERRKKEGK